MTHTNLPTISLCCVWKAVRSDISGLQGKAWFISLINTLLVTLTFTLCDLTVWSWTNIHLHTHRPAAHQIPAWCTAQHRRHAKTHPDTQTRTVQAAQYRTERHASRAPSQASQSYSTSRHWGEQDVNGYHYRYVMTWDSVVVSDRCSPCHNLAQPSWPHILQHTGFDKSSVCVCLCICVHVSMCVFCEVLGGLNSVFVSGWIFAGLARAYVRV